MSSTIYSRVSGLYGTLGAFYPTTGVQESLSENNASISVNCYNTKVYTTNEDIELKLPAGIQTGQMKQIVFSYKKTEPYNVLVTSDYFLGNCVINFKNQGDFVKLIYTGGVWTVLETGNFISPDLNTPWIQSR